MRAIQWHQSAARSLAACLLLASVYNSTSADASGREGRWLSRALPARRPWPAACRRPAYIAARHLRLKLAAAYTVFCWAQLQAPSLFHIMSLVVSCSASDVHPHSTSAL